MLRSLYIQNYALIEKLDISFETGFSVITGETGAGKSIILGAIGLLLGQRADVKAIRHGASKCIIEARFDISAYGMRPFFEENELEYDEECILRREVQSSGKSRAFINDTPASLAQVKELGERPGILVLAPRFNVHESGYALGFFAVLLLTGYCQRETCDTCGGELTDFGIFCHESGYCEIVLDLFHCDCFLKLINQFYGA